MSALQAALDNYHAVREAWLPHQRVNPTSLQGEERNRVQALWHEYKHSMRALQDVIRAENQKGLLVLVTLKDGLRIRIGTIGTLTNWGDQGYSMSLGASHAFHVFSIRDAVTLEVIDG